MLDIRGQIKDKFGQDCSFDVPASGFTTYKAGGPLEVLVKPATLAELAWLRKFCAEKNAPFLALGCGSNVLVSDKGLKGVAALTLKINKIEISGDLVTAGAGALWDEVVLSSVEAGLAGLEKTSGIPGTAGGAVFMNAGAFGQETFDALENFEAMDAFGTVAAVQKSEVKYGYRKVEGLAGLRIATDYRRAGGKRTDGRWI